MLFLLHISFVMSWYTPFFLEVWSSFRATKIQIACSHGILRFFFRCYFLEAICKTILSVGKKIAQNLSSPKTCPSNITKSRLFHSNGSKYETSQTLTFSGHHLLEMEGVKHAYLFLKMSKICS